MTFKSENIKIFLKLIMLACANIEQKPCGASLKEASLFLNHWFENIPFSRHHI